MNAPEFKYEVRDIKSSCTFCNKMKGSKTPETLAKYFVNIAILIQTPEWKTWHVDLFGV